MTAQKNSNETYTQLQPTIENKFFRGTHSWNIPGSTTIEDGSLDTYNPPIAPKKLPIPDFLSNIDPNVLQGVDPPGNLKDINYPPFDVFITKQIGKTNLKNITPKEAIHLAAQIVTGLIEYNPDAARLVLAGVNTQEKVRGILGEKDAEAAEYQNIVDRLPADKILMNNMMGICRNYSRVFIAVLDSLRRNQLKLGGHSLQNTYGVPVGDKTHDRVMIVTLGENGTHHFVPIDPTDIVYNIAEGKKRNNPDRRKLAVPIEENEKLLTDFFRVGYEAYEQKKTVLAMLIEKVPALSGLIGRFFNTDVSVRGLLEQLKDPKRIAFYRNSGPIAIADAASKRLVKETQGKLAQLSLDAKTKRG